VFRSLLARYAKSNGISRPRPFCFRSNDSNSPFGHSFLTPAQQNIISRIYLSDMKTSLMLFVWSLLSAVVVVLCPLYGLILVLPCVYLIYCRIHDFGPKLVFGSCEMVVALALPVIPFLVASLLSLFLRIISRCLSQFEIPWFKLCVLQVLGQSIVLGHWYFTNWKVRSWVISPLCLS
jgi:hypothetical protein